MTEKKSIRSAASIAAQRLHLVALSLLLAVSATAAENTPVTSDLPKATYQTQEIEGWKVHINDLLMKDEKVATEKMLVLLTAHLKEIVRVVPAKSVAHLRKIQLWLNPPYPGIAPRAEYHPGAGWLKAQKRNPDMVKCVEFTDVAHFEAETVRMPVFVLHELAHGFHDQVLGFDNPEIVAAYKKAVAGKTYDKVQRWHGVSGRVSQERAYAMSTPQEYFAECTEAYFGRNDFYPFTREELEHHDPEMYKIVERVWTSASHEASK